MGGFGGAMSILEYNGAAIIGMVGKDCVGIASDCRYGIQQMTVGTNMQKIFKINNSCMIGLAGLATDVQTMQQKLTFRTNMYKLRKEREMKPSTFSNVVSSVLYERRFGPYFVEPVVAGLEDGKPFLCAMDLIGAPVYTDNFVLSGTCDQYMYGACESFWKPDMVFFAWRRLVPDLMLQNPDELFETLSQSLLAATDRDCI